MHKYSIGDTIEVRFDTGGGQFHTIVAYNSTNALSPQAYDTGYIVLSQNGHGWLWQPYDKFEGLEDKYRASKLWYVAASEIKQAVCPQCYLPH
jgi:hypothetical protein